MDVNIDAFTLEYRQSDPTEDNMVEFPDGYWEASTDDGLTGAGVTEHDAMANLINILVQALDAAVAIGPPVAN